MNSFEVRLVRVQSELAIDGSDGIILAGTDQMRYLTGWQEGGHERFVGLLIPVTGDPVFLVPAMNAPQARDTPSGIQSVICWGDAEGWRAAAKAIIDAWDSAAEILVDDEMRSGHLLALQELFPATRFRTAASLMRRLREIKDDEELVAMRRAARLIDEVYEDVVLQLYTGMSELELADLILGEIKVRGSKPSFAPLICFGPDAALPHHHTGERRLAPGDVVIIDIGCVWNGYASDITRTIAYCEPSDPDARSIYDLVFHAHHAARSLAAEGVAPEAVDAAARDVISEAGYGEQFLHRTGHGIGLSVHEPPDIVKGGTAPLKQGMCFSIEPGVYLPGRFGVRIENIVTVTADGVASLNAEPDPVLRIIPVRA